MAGQGQFGVLGCGTYRAAILERGGGREVFDVPFETLSWGRRLDEISEASISIPSSTVFASEECCEIFITTEPFEHELAIFRGEDLAWVGPVWEVEADAEVGRIRARDMFSWLERSIVQARNVVGDGQLLGPAFDVGELWNIFIDDRLTFENSMNIGLNQAPITGITGVREIARFKFERVADVLRELARGGLDFTVIGRDILVSDEELENTFPQFDPIPALDDTTMIGAKTKKSGFDTATATFVKGEGQAGLTNAPPFGQDFLGVQGITAQFGLIEKARTERTVLDNATAGVAATSWLDLVGRTSPNPRKVTAIFRENAPVTLDGLVPGRLTTLHIEQDCIPYNGDARLVQVQAGANSNGAEAVTGIFEPIGTT